MILSSLLRAAASERVLTKPTKLGQLSRDVVFQWMAYIINVVKKIGLGELAFSWGQFLNI